MVTMVELIRPTSTADATTLASAAIDTMLHHKIGALPVVADRQLIGIVSQTDLWRARRPRPSASLGLPDPGAAHTRLNSFRSVRDELLHRLTRVFGPSSN